MVGELSRPLSRTVPADQPGTPWNSKVGQRAGGPIPRSALWRELVGGMTVLRIALGYYRILTVATIETILTTRINKRIVARPTLNRINPGIARKTVIIVAAVQAVRPRTATDLVQTDTAKQLVVASTTADHVIASSAINSCIERHSGADGHAIVTVQCVDQDFLNIRQRECTAFS